MPTFVKMMNGSNIPFDIKKSDFAKMSNEKMAIDRVFHKSFIEVDEERTEAAACTFSVNCVEPKCIKPKPIYFICNRPFIFLVHDKQYENVFFMGKYANPE